jgi:hypothetical protein
MRTGDGRSRAPWQPGAPAGQPGGMGVVSESLVGRGCFRTPIRPTCSPSLRFDPASESEKTRFNGSTHRGRRRTAEHAAGRVQDGFRALRPATPFAVETWTLSRSEAEIRTDARGSIERPLPAEPLHPNAVNGGPAVTRRRHPTAQRAGRWRRCDRQPAGTASAQSRRRSASSSTAGPTSTMASTGMSFRLAAAMIASGDGAS